MATYERKISAFTLLEVTLGTVLVGFLLFLSWLLVPRSVVINKQLALRDYAGLLAAEELSNFRSLPAGQIKEGIYREQSQVGPETCNFQVACEIYKVNGYELSELREAQVTVSWRYRSQSQVLRERCEACGMAF